MIKWWGFATTLQRNPEYRILVEQGWVMRWQWQSVLLNMTDCCWIIPSLGRRSGQLHSNGPGAYILTVPSRLAGHVHTLVELHVTHRGVGILSIQKSLWISRHVPSGWRQGKRSENELQLLVVCTKIVRETTLLEHPRAGCDLNEEFPQ